MKNRKGLNLMINENGFTIYAKLYNTVIYTQKDRVITLNSGGWHTKHTKNCINDLLPSGYGVYYKKGDWFLSCPEDVILPFVDNMTIILPKV